MITVCQALKDSLVELGVAGKRVTVLRNGVDLDTFKPMTPAERAAARTEFGLTGFSIASVGQLIERKGHHLIVEALRDLPDVTLLIAGAGPEREALAALAQRYGVSDRVRLLGVVPHAQLPKLYGAVDASVLASSREGWANVLLESMACGSPVVASRIWGTPEVVSRPEAGLLMPERSAQGIVAGIRMLRSNLPDRALTRRYATRFSWDATTEGQLRLFREVASGRAPQEATPHLTAA